MLKAQLLLAMRRPLPPPAKNLPCVDAPAQALASTAQAPDAQASAAQAPAVQASAAQASLYDAKHLIIECDLLEDYTRLGRAIQKWIERLNQRKTPAQEVVLTKHPFASLSVDQGEIQPESSEPDFTRAHVSHTSAASLSRDPSNLKDVGVSLHGSKVLQCGEIVDQSADTKVEIAAIDLAEINVTYHMESAPVSPKDPKRFDNNNCSEAVAPVDNQALEDVIAEELIDKSFDPIPYDL
ncbi:hypothetical protein LIER_32112 [Lithospermum erythrorhizon]|uniref:Uncharacterized protein n=1 Tax=Lithospermum erythrorhizon TaxID=34254 RepID=A0AAV3RTS7_LITER